jgi:PAS domain S-box-containing protein
MKKKILIIDQDDTNYALLSKQLSALNYLNDHIFRCFSVQEALSAQNENIDIILAKFPRHSDILPGLRALKIGFIHAPIIILSGQDDNELAIQLIQNGAQDFLIQGMFNTAQLDKAILFAIERKARSTKMINLAAAYEKHFDNGPIPMWVVDHKTMKFHVVNKAAVEKYGYSKEEFGDMSLLDIRPKEDITDFVNKFSQNRKEYFDAGYARHLKKNGVVFYVHVYSHAIVFDGIESRLSFLVDVNEKLLADKENAKLASLIKEQKEDLDSILFSINDAIWSRRADTMELSYANNAYYRLYGYEPGDPRLEDKLKIEMIYPDDRANFRAAMNEVQTTGKTELIYRYVNKDGCIKILKASAVLKKGINGKPDMINGVSTDITQEKELYDTIRNNEQKLRATIDNTDDLIWSVDKELKIIFCNKAFHDFFYKLAGVDLDEGDYVLGSWRPASFVEKRKSDYQRAFNGESFSTIVEENMQGNTLYFEIRSNPIIDVSGRIAGVTCTSRDITEQRELLLKIQQQNEKLREIAWIQSHKVRGPVASILGLIPLFDYEAAGNEHNADILHKLEGVTNELDSVIREIVFSINTVDNP